MMIKDDDAGMAGLSNEDHGNSPPVTQRGDQGSDKDDLVYSYKGLVIKV